MRMFRSMAVPVLALLLTILSGCGDDKTDTTKPVAAAPATAVAPTPTTASAAAPANETTIAATAVDSASGLNTQDSGNNEAGSHETRLNPELYRNVPMQVTLISESLYDGGNTVAIRFSAPLDNSRPFADYIRVNGSTRQQWLLADDGLTLYMLDAKPRTTYQIQVDPGIRAANGSQLQNNANTTVEISPAPPSLGFATQGHYLLPGMNKGLPVLVQNVNEANVSFYRVKNDTESLAALLDWSSTNGRIHTRAVEPLNRFAEMVHEGRYTLNPKPDHRQQINLPLDAAALQQSGVYVALMWIPGQPGPYLSSTWYSVSNLGLHLRSGNDNRLDIYVNQFDNGQPVKNAFAETWGWDGRNNRVISHGSTDQQGHLQLRNKNGQALIVRQGDQFSMLSLQQASLDLSEFDPGSRPAFGEELFLYGPRDIYRSGETLQVSALLRNQDGSPVKPRALKANLFQPDGQRLKELSLSHQAGGYYQLDYPLAKTAQTGDWRLTVDMPDRRTAVWTFKVEDFMPERLKISWNPQQPPRWYQPRDALQVDVLGEYLYGAPAAGNRFDASVRVSPLVHPFAKAADFYFGDPEQNDWNRELEQLNLHTGNDGHLTLTINSEWQQARIPLQATITGSLFESGGRAVVRRHRETILPAESLIGIRPMFKDSAATNALAGFELIHTNSAGAKLAASDLQITLVRHEHNYHWRYDNDSGWYYDEQNRDVKEMTLLQNIVAGNTATVQLPVRWGHYSLEVLDPHSGLQTRFDFDAGDDWYWNYADNQQARPDRVQLSLDKEAYQGGDVARLKLTPPAAGESLILVESDKLLWSTRVHTNAGDNLVDIPIDARWNQHNIYISVVHLQAANDPQRITPARAIGLLHLPLDRSDRQLQVSLKTPPKWLPERTVNAEIEVKDSRGQPVSGAWLTLAAVDEGVLSLTRFKSPQPLPFFFGQRRFGWDLMDNWGDLISLDRNRLASLRWGGDGSLESAGDMARAEVKVVSLFSGKVEVKNGVASVPLNLPDFNGQLRLMAVAFDDNRFGSADQKVIVAAPLVAELAMPRFVAVGDQTSLALDLTNLSDHNTDLKVSLKASGAATLDGPQSQLSLAVRERQTLHYSLKALDPAGSIQLSLEIDGMPDYPIKRQWTLNSRQAYPAETRQQRTSLEAGASLNLPAEALASWNSASLRAGLSISSYIDLDTASQLRNLLHYPYGCLEQTISSGYPWLYATEEQLQQLDLPGVSAAQRQSALAKALEGISSRQRDNGGYSLWNANSGSEEHWLTAYAGSYLSDALDGGQSIDQTLLDKTLQRLQQYSRNQANFDERWSDNPELYRLAYQAYASFVLARHQQARLADLRNLAKRLPERAPALSVVHLALAAQLQGDQALAGQLADNALQHINDGKLRPTQYLGDYGSAVRDLAWISYLAAHYQLSDTLAARALQELQTELGKRRWYSTQEHLALMQAALEQEKHAGHQWQAILTVNNSSESLNATATGYRLLKGPVLEQGLTLTNNGDQRLYTSLQYQGVPAQKPEPYGSHGLSVQRMYYDTKGKALDISSGTLTLKTGDLVLVELLVHSDDYRPDLMLSDLLPAGLEAENQNLADSFKLDEIRINNRGLDEWQSYDGYRHQEYRDDRVAIAVATGGDYYWGGENPRLFYLARAVTPGEYQVPPPQLEDMYQPEARAVGATIDKLVVQP